MKVNPSFFCSNVQIARHFRVNITCAISPNFGCLLFDRRWEINTEKQTKQANSLSLSLSFFALRAKTFCSLLTHSLDSNDKVPLPPHPMRLSLAITT